LTFVLLLSNFIEFNPLNISALQALTHMIFIHIIGLHPMLIDIAHSGQKANHK